VGFNVVVFIRTFSLPLTRASEKKMRGEKSLTLSFKSSFSPRKMTSMAMKKKFRREL
jgi:hypothetical protein